MDEVIARALAAGWSYERTLLYDEEGVEGFEWIGPNGQTVCSEAVDGCWSNGPEVPDKVRRLLGEG